MPVDGRDAARRIVDEVFGGSLPDDAAEASTGRQRPTPASTPARSPATSPEPEREPSRARLRARELVAEVFDPAETRQTAPAAPPAALRPSAEETTATPARPATTGPPRSAAPSAAELAGRRIVAEAEAAQQARAAAEAAELAAARRAAEEAEAAERAAARRAAEEAEAEAHRERALRARQEWLERAQAEAPPAPPPEEVLFVPPETDPPSRDEGDHLFGPPQPADVPGVPPSSGADVDGPPPPPEPLVALALPDDPPVPQLAARLVSEVLEERAGVTPHIAGTAPEPAVTGDTGARPLRAGRWVLVTVLAAVALALLFPLAVRAVLELVSLS